MKSKFEEWFQQQHFYLNLRFIHGERLFIFDAQDGYVVQAVQIAWTTWMEQQKRIDACENLLAKWKSKGLVGSSDYARGGLHSRQDCEDELEQALKGSEPKVQEPQACDHIMTEKTQFGDLHQTFECIFCDHKTTEAWVTKHE